MAKFSKLTPMDVLRSDIAQHCLEGAMRPKGLYTLTVPTGGGKTLASLQYALHHANKWGMDRVIYVIPFTSIIDQNAEVVRSILEPSDNYATHGRVVLEHHGSLTPEKQGWREKLLSENWDAPIVFTTNVQLLETLFGGGTRAARRMHQLANSVIIFDEIQTLPIKCVHLFNNAINFLVEQCGSTVVLCTATQPLLDKVEPMYGSLNLPIGNELMPNIKDLFAKLKRVKIINHKKPGGWSYSEVADLAVSEYNRIKSCLVVVNAKESALSIYNWCKSSKFSPNVAHLSTNLCPAHRKKILKFIRRCLRWNVPILCVSTQLIEAGVDVDFGAVIRATAGLDSVAQAAGRCNRHGVHEFGIVHLVKLRDEKLGKLKEIKIGQDVTERVLLDFEVNPEKYDYDIIGPKMLEWYYLNYFHSRKSEMTYKIEAEETDCRDDTLLRLLSGNKLAVDAHKGQALHLQQSFMTAA